MLLTWRVQFVPFSPSFVLLERDDFCSPQAGPLSLECGGLTPLWLCLSFSPLLERHRAKSKADAKRKRRQATALQNGSMFLLGASTQNKNGIKDIGLDKQKLNTPLLTPLFGRGNLDNAGTRSKKQDLKGTKDSNDGHSQTDSRLAYQE
jgi:hypothetical protein